MKNYNNVFFVALFFFLAIGSCLYSGHYALAQTDQTSSKLQAANTAIDRAFNTVSDAEKSGANITQLLKELNDAGALLAQADNSFRIGDLANVTSNADNARLIANQVNTDAISLRNEANNTSQIVFMFTLIFSVIGAIISVVVLFLVWRRFKSSYTKKLLSLKPQGVKNTT
jgi:CHASE3 domain sensor protein